MRHLNYNHLHYFWTVANEGSIAQAAESLHITPQTISGQLKLLDEAVGEPLLRRAGRGLVLTETGHLIKQYADEIFATGAELAQMVRDREPHAQQVLRVGLVNSIAKLIGYRTLEPALDAVDPVKLICCEGELESLLGELAVHRLDLVISDRPIPVGMSVKAYNHPMGGSAVSFFCGKAQAARYRRDFPHSLEGAPVLLPAPGCRLRRDLNDWFERVDVRPHIVAEFDDSALLKAFGQAGKGLFPAPHAIAPEIERMYQSRVIGRVEGVQETYVAISPERRLKHPAVMAITAGAKQRLADQIEGTHSG